MTIKQYEKSTENILKLANEPNAVFMKVGQRVRPTGAHHHKPTREEEKTHMVSINYKMLDSMKISDMKEWIDDPNTALVVFED